MIQRKDSHMKQTAISRLNTGTPRTWFITGASRGLGAEIAKAALQAGDQVVATGRSRASLSETLGTDNERLLSLALDVTDANLAKAAVETSISRFGSIDVLVNNAGYGLYGFFEETNIKDAHEHKVMKPFGWTAGKTLFRWFEGALGWTEDDFRARIYIAAVARCFPGKAKGNWTWQLEPGQLTPELAARLRELTAASGRAPKSPRRP